MTNTRRKKDGHTKSFYMPTKLSEDFDKAAKEEGLTKSCFIRKILQAYFDKKINLYKH